MDPDLHWNRKLLQKWEHQFLYFDTLHIFAPSVMAKEVITRNKIKAVNELLADWHEMDMIHHIFEIDEYNEYKQNLEDQLFLTAGSPVTREKLQKYRNRSMDMKLCSIDQEGEVRLNQSFYYATRWQRDISGWDMLEKNSTDPTIKQWFRRFKERAMCYQRSNEEELNGGPPTEYDFACGRKGPFPEITI
jgi:2-succinyl-5-enolpyruvyl-6-hydroxy-3-cyclohexene-1-carboxylate synthase